MESTHKKYAIVNDYDAPSPHLVAQKIGDGFYYMRRSTDRYLERYDGTPYERPTFLEDFGFNIYEREYQVDFARVRESIATYEDGKHRRWQGPDNFALPIVKLKEKEVTKCKICGYSAKPKHTFTERKHFTSHVLTCERCNYSTESKASLGSAVIAWRSIAKISK